MDQIAFFTANQLLAHLVGDYLFQSQWMADNKAKLWRAAFVHGITYTLAFVFLTHNPLALALICLTHVVIDHYGLARYVVWFKNWFLSPVHPELAWRECSKTGYPERVPPYMAVWLLIVADNTLHLLCNALILYYVT